MFNDIKNINNSQTIKNKFLICKILELNKEQRKIKFESIIDSPPNIKKGDILNVNLLSDIINFEKDHVYAINSLYKTDKNDTEYFLNPENIMKTYKNKNTDIKSIDFNTTPEIHIENLFNNFKSGLYNSIDEYKDLLIKTNDILNNSLFYYIKNSLNLNDIIHQIDKNLFIDISNIGNNEISSLAIKSERKNEEEYTPLSWTFDATISLNEDIHVKNMFSFLENTSIKEKLNILKCFNRSLALNIVDTFSHIEKNISILSMKKQLDTLSKNVISNSIYILNEIKKNSLKSDISTLSRQKENLESNALEILKIYSILQIIEKDTFNIRDKNGLTITLEKDLKTFREEGDRDILININGEPFKNKIKFITDENYGTINIEYKDIDKRMLIEDLFTKINENTTDKGIKNAVKLTEKALKDVEIINFDIIRKKLEMLNIKTLSNYIKSEGENDIHCFVFNNNLKVNMNYKTETTEKNLLDILKNKNTHTIQIDVETKESKEKYNILSFSFDSSKKQIIQGDLNFETLNNLTNNLEEQQEIVTEIINNINEINMERKNDYK